MRVAKQRMVLVLLAAILIETPPALSAQQAPRTKPRLCFLGSGARETAIDLAPLYQRLHDLGYVEGKNIAFERRYFEGQVERAPAAAAELVRSDCDIILTTGTEAALAASRATKTIPVVMGFSGDAVRLGLVADLARPGGNVTGLTSINIELSGKRLELLKEVVPRLTRVAILWSQTNPNTEILVKELEDAARALKIGLQSITVTGPNDLENAFQKVAADQAQAILFGGGGLFGAHRQRIVDLVAKLRRPAMFPNVRFVELGGLMTYGEDRAYMFRRAADYVDRILKGTTPTDLPVERPRKFELIINLKAAKQIGLTIPPNVLARADRVIR